MTVPFRDCYIAISTDGANWVDLSESGSVEIVAGAGQRPTTELYAYGADAPIVVPGRRRPMRLGITYGYADAARDDTIRSAYEAGSADTPPAITCIAATRALSPAHPCPRGSGTAARRRSAALRSRRPS
jgi:hypothetical protein